MLVSILKGICWLGYIVCGTLLLGYLFSYLNVKRKVDEERKDKRK